MEVAALSHDPLAGEPEEDRPGALRFFQAVRLLERRHPGRAPVGEFGDPAGEVVRFAANPRLGFPVGEVASLTQPADGPARMSVNFMGLTGPSGVLPYEYSLLTLQRLRGRDEGTAAFLDLFHHRLLSLFYRAWEKHRFTVGREKGRDRLREHALELTGAGGGDAGGGEIPADVLAFYAGLLSLRRPTAVGLEQLLTGFFAVPATVEQFVGDWYPLTEEDACVLGEEGGVSTRLGAGAVIGDEVWEPQARIRVRLGPLAREEYDRILPTGALHAPLRSLVRLFTQDEFGVEVQLVLRREAVAGCALGGEAPQPLGWSTWIRSAAFDRDPDETILAL